MGGANLYTVLTAKHMHQDEISLVQALHRGDRYACDDLVKQYSNKIYNVALRLTGHPADAEEVLQETFINACKGAESFKGNSSLGTWLYRIATNNGLMRLRRREAQTVPLELSSEEGDGRFRPTHLQDWDWNPETMTLSGELRLVMDEAVASLPDTLRYLYGLNDCHHHHAK